jgi:hypothetical protein
MIRRPESLDFPPFQEKYIALVPDDVMNHLIKQKSTFSAYIDSLTEERLNYRYAEDKWTIRESIMHVIDTEQVFSYRALAVSRGDIQNLSGFDQNIYVDNFNSERLGASYLNKYFNTTRDNFLTLAEGMQDSDWEKSGTMSSYTMRLNAFPFMIAGHLDHHLAILKNNY